jgi:hypothetical protein
MKQKSHMTPDEFRTFVASEVESILSDIEQLRITAEHLNEPAGLHIAPSAAPATAYAARHQLPALQEAQRA